MGRRDISERYVRWTGWVWIVVFACAAFAALFVVLVQTNPNEGIKAGEILQAVASLAGSALGIVGAFMLARWSLGEAERERIQHRYELARLTMNSVVGLASQFKRWSATFDKLNCTHKAIIAFKNMTVEMQVEKLAPSPVLRTELIAAYPALENALFALDGTYTDLYHFLEKCVALGDKPGREVAFKYNYRGFVECIYNLSFILSVIKSRFDEARRLADKETTLTKDFINIEEFRAAAEELARRTAPEVLSG